MKNKTLSESRLARLKDIQDCYIENPTNPQIRKILIQTEIAEILDSISELI